jgi:glutamine amidotransferase
MAAIVGSDNVIGFQFHPEKSQKIGLKLLSNFAEWCHES